MMVVVAGTVAGSGLGCDDISLTNGSDVPTANGASAPSAASDAGGSSGGGLATGTGSGAFDAGSLPSTPANVADASMSSGTVGNPLCFITYGADAGGAHNCLPDVASPSNYCAPDDAGWYSPSDDAGDGGPPLTACHVIPSNSQACTAAGPGGDGDQCQTSTDCAASFECVGSPGECRHYCCGGNASCDNASALTTSATFCDVQPTASGALNVPVCEPITACTLLVSGPGPGTCPTAETCAVVTDDGTTSCVAIGPVGIGRSCDVLHCQAGLTCLGAVGARTCFELCEVDAPTCSGETKCTSSAQLFANANVGICQ
jgi:hypothetical protein